MIKEEIQAVIKKRMDTDSEWDYGIEQCWNSEIEILSKTISDTITFLETDCTAEEFSWLSEVFEEVAKKTQSRAFVDCLYHVAKKYPDICKQYHIDFVIQCAEGAIEEDQNLNFMQEQSK